MKFSSSKARLAQNLATVSGSLAASVASSQASVVQITLTGNKLTSSANTLNADVTGDGTNDIAITGVARGAAFVSILINGGGVRATNYMYSGAPVFGADAQFAANGVGVATQFLAGGPRNIKYLNPISFTDARINGGASTRGFLEVNAFNTSQTSQTVALTRLVFDNASTTLGTSGLSTSATYTAWTAVPEPSSLGLLALGAGGLVARRRRRRRRQAA